MVGGTSYRVGRRRWLRGAAALALSPGIARAEPEPPPADLDVRELTLDGDPKLARSALLLTPKDAGPTERLPVLVLLHGLGETWDEKVGRHAWSDRYGLVAADARLRRPPLTLPKPSRYVTEERLEAMSRELAAKPYRGAVLVCPFTPNIHKLPREPLALDGYADWIARTLLPAVRRESPVARGDAAGTAIDGCSLGGYMALEVFIRKPELFGAVGGVQAAMSERAGPLYAQLIRDAIDRVGPRAVHVETSSWDPELKGQEAFSHRLESLGVPHDYVVLPGGHDQIFLRERGTLEMLFWHDRRFAR